MDIDTTKLFFGEVFEGSLLDDWWTSGEELVRECHDKGRGIEEGDYRRIGGPISKITTVHTSTDAFVIRQFGHMLHR